MSLKMKDDGDDFDQMMFTPISAHHGFNNLDDHDHGDHDDLCQSYGDQDDHENSIDHDPLSSSYIRIMQYLRNFL